MLTLNTTHGVLTIEQNTNEPGFRVAILQHIGPDKPLGADPIFIGDGDAEEIVETLQLLSPHENQVSMECLETGSDTLSVVRTLDGAFFRVTVDSQDSIVALDLDDVVQVINYLRERI